MPLSVQGNTVLSKMFDDFQRTYVEKNPGVNMNDVERDFLYHMLHALVYNSTTYASYSQELKETEALIDKVR